MPMTSTRSPHRISSSAWRPIPWTLEYGDAGLAVGGGGEAGVDDDGGRRLVVGSVALAQHHQGVGGPLLAGGGGVTGDGVAQGIEYLTHQPALAAGEAAPESNHGPVVVLLEDESAVEHRPALLDAGDAPVSGGEAPHARDVVAIGLGQELFRGAGFDQPGTHHGPVERRFPVHQGIDVVGPGDAGKVQGRLPGDVEACRQPVDHRAGTVHPGHLQLDRTLDEPGLHATHPGHDRLQSDQLALDLIGGKPLDRDAFIHADTVPTCL